MTSHIAINKDTVEKDLSPPESCEVSVCKDLLFGTTYEKLSFDRKKKK